MTLVFDKYELVERLAVGGMGEVLLARQRGVSGFERLVVLKTLLPEHAADQGFVDQFLDEGRLAAALSHPHVVSVFEVGAWSGTYFLAMEYIPGPNLQQLLKAGVLASQPLPIHLGVRIIHDAALGLDHAHRARDVHDRPLSLVHRDVSPHNIMVRPDGVTKVVDFGIARAANRSSRTRTGVVKGKLAYMAPEQLLNGDLDGRADQFSLGVIFWELCTGQQLFAAKDDIAAMRALLSQPIPAPDAVAPVPTAISDVVMRMLRREAHERYPSCADVAADLAAWLKQAPEPTEPAALAAFIEAVDARPARSASVVPANFVMQLKPPPAELTPTVSDRRAAPATRRGRWALGALTATFAIAAGVWALVPAQAPAPTPAPVVPLAPDPEPDAGAASEATGPAAPPVDVPAVAQPPSAPGTLLVTSKVRASVSIDGVVRGKTPLTLSLPPGSYLVRAEAEGFVASESRARVGLKKATRLQLNLVPVAAEGARPAQQTNCTLRPGEACLVVRTHPIVRLAIDGRVEGVRSVVRALAAGPHELHFTDAALGIDQRETVTLTAGTECKVLSDFTRNERVECHAP